MTAASEPVPFPDQCDQVASRLSGHLVEHRRPPLPKEVKNAMLQAYRLLKECAKMNANVEAEHG